MAVTIKALGLKKYLDRVYADAGGYDRFVKLVADNWPNQQIAKEFGANRMTVYTWKKHMAEELQEEGGV